MIEKRIWSVESEFSQRDKPDEPHLRMRLENFRVFKDSGWFTLAPLTCLVGRNSSGKSSIISSIMLLKQSLEEQGISAAPMALSLTGPYCDLGNYSDVVYDHDESAELSFSFAASVGALFADESERRGQLVDFSLPRPLPIPRRYFSGTWIDAKRPPKGSVEIRLSYAADARFGPSLCRLEVSASSLGSASFVRTTGMERRQHWRVYTADLPRQSLQFHVRPRSFFPFISTRSESFSRCAPTIKHRIRSFVAAFQWMFRLITDTLSMSAQVGPFRTPPERRYAGGVSGGRGGPSGEQAVSLLITEALLRPNAPRPLHRAVSFWVKHLGLARSIDVRDLGKRLNLFQVDIKGARQGTQANLSDVGFGVSQILPVLVQGMLMSRGGIYVVQQPEIHLHPDAQAGLADFFLYLAARGVMVLVETHSEYFLLRLRLRLAEGGRPVPRAPGSGPARTLFASDVSVLLTGSDRRDSVVRRLQINESFQFENLPVGFMSQALEDRSALLKILAKRNA